MNYDNLTVESIAQYCAEKSNFKINKADLESQIQHLINIEQAKQLTLTDVGCRKLNEWIKIDPTKANTIPEEPVWIMTIDRKEIEYKEADEYIELNYASHYRLIDEPEPPL